LPALSVTGLSLVPSTVNATVPAGVVVPDAGETVAVKVTELPAACGLALDVSVVVVEMSDDEVMVSVSGALVLELKVALPG
jgi:hypothetical protein